MDDINKDEPLQRHMDFLDTGGKLPVTGNLITLENAHTGPATWFGALGYSGGNFISADKFWK